MLAKCWATVAFVGLFWVSEFRVNIEDDIIAITMLMFEMQS